jgi:hypothetical protein
LGALPARTKALARPARDASIALAQKIGERSLIKLFRRSCRIEAAVRLDTTMMALESFSQGL